MVADSVPEARYVLEHGRFWNLGERARPKGTRKMADGACFRNAWIRTSEPKGWRYVEGWACSPGGFVISHAWVVDAADVVIETTWLTLANAYFGVVVPFG